jgi:hypothetical protein
MTTTAEEYGAVLFELVDQLPALAKRDVVGAEASWLPTLTITTANVAQVLYSNGPAIYRDQSGLGHLFAELVETAGVALLIAARVQRLRQKLERAGCQAGGVYTEADGLL